MLPPPDRDTEEEEWGAGPQKSASGAQPGGAAAGDTGRGAQRTAGDQFPLPGPAHRDCGVTLHERAAESGPAPAPFGKSHDANSYQVRPEERMSRAASHDNHCPLSVLAEKQAFEVNSHLLWGLIARMPVFHEGHFINHSKSKPVREERKRKDALEKHRHLPVP